MGTAVHPYQGERGRTGATGMRGVDGPPGFTGPRARSTGYGVDGATGREVSPRLV